MIPVFALFRSKQLGSFAPELFWHIEPVRSSTSMMSSGLTPHGEHAVERTWTLSVLMPKKRTKNVLTWPVSWTLTAFTGLQPGTDARHRVETTSSTLLIFDDWFLPPAAVPNCFAVATAAAGSGSSWAPARAAASADAWSERCA